MKAELLVVDDDVDTSEMLRDLLIERGYAVEVCRSAEAAIERIRHQDFDVVITDVRMDGASGLTLCEQVSEQYPDVLTIVMTGHSSVDVAISAIRAGAYDFV